MEITKNDFNVINNCIKDKSYSVLHYIQTVNFSKESKFYKDNYYKLYNNLEKLKSKLSAYTEYKNLIEIEIELIELCISDRIKRFSKALEENLFMDFWEESDVDDVKKALSNLKNIQQKLNKLEELKWVT